MKYIYLGALIVILNFNALAQQVQFPYSNSTVTVDGILSSSEWANANIIWIKVNTSDSVRVQYQHDSTALHFAFAGKMESANALFPEILIDAQNQRTDNWTTGQWWFHVSATDCENEGGYGVYNNCLAVQSDWEGAPNFTQGPPATDTVEFSIPFSKVGIDINTTDTIGIAFVVTNTFNIFKLWPASANKDVPSSWGYATLQKMVTAIPDYQTSPDIYIYPNPAAHKVTINNAEIGSVISLSDLTGKPLLSTQVQYQYEEIDLSSLPGGLYLLNILNSMGKLHTVKISKL